MTILNANELIELKLYHEIHVSEIREFQKCEQAWDWKYNKQYYPISKAKPLEFGTAYHAGMAKFYTPEESFNYLDAQEEFLRVSDQQRDEALSRTTDEEEISEIEKDFEERKDLGIGMLEYYFSEISSKEDALLTPIFTEVTFAAQIGSMWCNCKKCQSKIIKAINNKQLNIKIEDIEHYALPVCAEGTIDIVFKHLNGHLIIGDWKTTTKIKDRHEWLQLDLQMKMYVWAMRQLGYNVKEAFYQEAVKDYPKMLNKLEKPRAGKSYSVDKTQSTTYDLAVFTVATYDKEAYLEGRYDDYLNWLKDNDPVLVNRTYLHFTDDALTLFGEYIYDVANRIIHSNNNLMISPSSYNCGYCEFLQPCIEKQEGQQYTHLLNSNFEIREHYYNEET